ncbi:MAG: TIGR02281 family clan AA aspartic protease [Hyphomicrobiaceae bacterium]
MAISSGSRGLVKLAASWVVSGAVIAVSLVHGEEIRTALGLKIEASDHADEQQRAPSHGVARRTPRTESTGDRSVKIRAGANGHYDTTAHINGRAIEVMVDTGATAVALTYEDANAAGIYPRPGDFTQKVNTANGVARVAPVTLDSVSIADITVRNVRAVVAESGQLNVTLLGMTFLGRLGRAEMSRGVLTLQE